MAESKKNTPAEGGIKEENTLNLNYEDDKPCTTQIKTTKKEDRRFDAIASILGLRKNEAFSALMDYYDGKVDPENRAIDIQRFREYLTAQWYMFTEAVRYSENCTRMTEDRLLTEMKKQEELIQELKEKNTVLQAIADREQETEEKLNDAHRQIEDLQFQIESFRQINDNLQKQVKDLDKCREMEGRIREMETELAVLRREKEMAAELTDRLLTGQLQSKQASESRQDSNTATSPFQDSDCDSQ